MGVDATIEERRNLLARLVPFLVERSNTTLKKTDEAIDYVLSRVDDNLVSMLIFRIRTRANMKLQIASRRRLAFTLVTESLLLLRVPPITLLEKRKKTSDKAFLALSDLYRIASYPVKKDRKKRLFPLAAPKLLFYASNLGRMPRTSLLQQMAVYRNHLEKEEREDEALRESISQPLAPETKSTRTLGRPQPIIEEIT